MSQSPEEQPSTGVLGRIGSWFSPWKGKSPTSPTENAFPVSYATPRAEAAGETSQELVRSVQAEEQKGPSVGQKQHGLSGDCSSREEGEDAAQSAHGEGAVSSEPAQGGPTEEETVLQPEPRIGGGGRGREREGCSNSPVEGGTPTSEQTASHLTRVSSSSCEQEAAWKSDQPHPRPWERARVPAARKLDIYLEETSVVLSGQDNPAGQAVVCTTVKKSLQVISQSQPAQGIDSVKSPEKVGDNRRVVCHSVESPGQYRAPVGVSLKPHLDTLSEAEPGTQEEETDSMVRKNTGKRKSRKNSQGDAGNSSQENASSTVSLTAGSPQASDPHLGEAHVVPAPSTPSPAVSPGEGIDSSPTQASLMTTPTGKQSDIPQDLASPLAACSVDGAAVMEPDSRFYKVQRKTETAETKRRSLKVSQTEVKFFPKKVLVTTERAREGTVSQGIPSGVKDADDKSNIKAVVNSRPQDLEEIVEEPKPVSCHISDKISLFESQPEGPPKKILQSHRSADVSPVRTVPDRVKANVNKGLVLSQHRSTERDGSTRSEKPKTVKEKARNFAEACKSEDKSALPQKSAMTKMPQSVLATVSMPSELDLQAKQAATQIASKPDWPDTNTMTSNISVAKIEKEFNTKSKKLSKPEELCLQSNSVEVDSPAQGPGDKEEIANQISPRGKAPAKIGSRIKRKKVREPYSPSSPNKDVKLGSPTSSKDEVSVVVTQDQTNACLTSKDEVSVVVTQDHTNACLTSKDEVSVVVTQDQTNACLSIKDEASVTITQDKTNSWLNSKDEASVVVTQENTNACEDTAPPTEELTKTLTSLPGKPLGTVTESVSDTNKQTLSKISDTEIDMYFKGNTENKSIVNKDKSDAPICSSGTKVPIDKVQDILPAKEESAKEHSPQNIEKTEHAFIENDRILGPSHLLLLEERPLESEVKQDVPIEYSKLDNHSDKLKQHEKKQDENRENKTAVGLEERQSTEKKAQVDMKASEKTHQSENTDKGNAQQQHTKHTANGMGSDIKQDTPGTEASKAETQRIKKNKHIKDSPQIYPKHPDTVKTPLKNNVGSAAFPIEMQTINITTTKHLEENTVYVETNEITSMAEIDKDPPNKEEAATNMSELKVDSMRSSEIIIQAAVTTAEPQPKSTSVEKTEKSPDDSQAREVDNSTDFSKPELSFKGATAMEEMTELFNKTSALKAVVPTQDNTVNPIKQSVESVKESKPTPISVPRSVNSERTVPKAGEESRISSLATVLKDSENITQFLPNKSQADELNKTRQTKASSSAKPTEVQTIQSPSGTIAATTAQGGTTDKELGHVSLPIGNRDKHPHSDLPLSQIPESLPWSAQATKLLAKPSSGSSQGPSQKKIPSLRGRSLDDSSLRRESPSSWLDVDFPQHRLKAPESKLSSSGSESNLLDTSGELDDDDFVEKIKKLCAPFSFPPRKHSYLRAPQPPFAMPAIKEDRFEKTFDPEGFQFGLRKTKFSSDSSLVKLKSTETKAGLKPARASIADRSMLLTGMDTFSRLREKTANVDKQKAAEETKDDQIQVKSRLDGSRILSSLYASNTRGNRNGLEAGTTDTIHSGALSPNEPSQPIPPPVFPAPLSSPTSTVSGILTEKSLDQADGAEAPAEEAFVSDSYPPLPSFNDIKLPDYLEKYLPREPATPVASTGEMEQHCKELVGGITPACPAAGTEVHVKPGLLLSDGTPPGGAETPSKTPPQQPELQPQAPLQRMHNNDIRPAKGLHRRPGKMVLFESPQFEGKAYEIFRDIADATSLQLSPCVSVRVVRGCWILYEKPDFQGRCIALEEGSIELTNVWAEPESGRGTPADPPMLIGSVRLAISDYSLPHIDLFTDPEGHGRVTPYHDDTIEICSFGNPQSTASIKVHSGVWLVFGDPGYQGMLAVMEQGEYPVPESWGFPSPFIGSLRPLKMGGFKVERPNEVKALVYEMPGFEGSCMEVDSEVFSFCNEDGTTEPDSKMLSVGSLKITGGLWVGYSQPGFEGQQHILEEGEYLDCKDWGGGSQQLLSLRPVMTNFMSPHIKMFSERDFGKLGVNIDLTVPVPNMDDTDYGLKTQSLVVLEGVWVAFEEPGFSGEPYLLEKGLYGSPEDWGAMRPHVASVMPVVLDDFEISAKFKVELFSEPSFHGAILVLEDSTPSLQEGFAVASCRVLAGSWLAYEGQDFADRMYVLEEGNYPDLRAMGCVDPSSSIMSLQTTGFEFSLPSVTLFERSGLRGKRVVLTDGSVNLPAVSGCGRVQSVLVEGGMWVMYEGINYRGAQILLKPGEVPDWRLFSSWQRIGSLRPLLQKQVYFSLRNQETGLLMSLTGDLEDVKLMRIQETEDTGGPQQIWFYQNGHLHCKLLEECSLSPCGSMIIAGSRVGVSPEPNTEQQLWSITPDGCIRYMSTPDLILDVKGGLNYDKNQVILNKYDPGRLTQKWNLEII